MEPQFTSLAEVRSYIAKLAGVLDPWSRYVHELLEIVRASQDVDDLRERLRRGCRGRRFSTPAIYDAMTLADQLRANLITNETQVYRFEDEEARVLDAALRRIARVHEVSSDEAPVSVLVAPCSHGAEAYTIASLALHAGVRIRVDAWDIQAVCIDSARRGIVQTGIPSEHLAQPALVTPAILEPITFEVVDLIAWSSREDNRLWDIVQCRNFVGYFTVQTARQLLTKLMGATRPGGLLVLDPFPDKKFVWLAPELELEGFRKRGPAAWEKGGR